MWTGDFDLEDVQNTYKLVLELTQGPEETCMLTLEWFMQTSIKCNKCHDARSRDRKFTMSDKVLILLPSDRNTSTMQWQGPISVKGEVAKLDNDVAVGGGVRTFHANILKKYVVRESDELNKVVSFEFVAEQAVSCVIEEERSEGWNHIRLSCQILD